MRDRSPFTPEELDKLRRVYDAEGYYQFILAIQALTGWDYREAQGRGRPLAVSWGWRPVARPGSQSVPVPKVASIPYALYRELQTLKGAGKRIEAINSLRALPGWNLQTAQEYVDLLPPFHATLSDLPRPLWMKLQAMAAAGAKFEAVWLLHRLMPGETIKADYEYIEQLALLSPEIVAARLAAWQEFTPMPPPEVPKESLVSRSRPALNLRSRPQAEPSEAVRTALQVLDEADQIAAEEPYQQFFPPGTDLKELPESIRTALQTLAAGGRNVEAVSRLRRLMPHVGLKEIKEYVERSPLPPAEKPAPLEISAADRQAVQTCLDAGRYVDAVVRLQKAVPGLSMADAKQYIYRWSRPVAEGQILRSDLIDFLRGEFSWEWMQAESYIVNILGGEYRPLLEVADVTAIALALDRQHRTYQAVQLMKKVTGWDLFKVRTFLKTQRG